MCCQAERCEGSVWALRPQNHSETELKEWEATDSQQAQSMREDGMTEGYRKTSAVEGVGRGHRVTEWESAWRGCGCLNSTETLWALCVFAFVAGWLSVSFRCLD